MAMRNRRSGFTLVELLVATAILLILAGLSVGVIRVALEGDRVPSTARQIQSYLEGARNQAIFSQEDRGVRFIRHEARPTEVVSMVYIGAPDTTDGTADVDTVVSPTLPGPDPMADILTQSGGTQSWTALANRNLLAPGARIRVGTTPPIWYTIHPDTFDPDPAFTAFYLEATPPKIRITGSWLGAAVPLTDEPYTLELAAVPLPDAEVVTLPQGVVIDVDPARTRQQTSMPNLWQDPNNDIEVLFSPHGTATGYASSFGLVHFLIADIRDTEFGRVIGNTKQGIERKQGEELIVTLFTRTGLIETSPVDVTDADLDGDADDPYRFAETGTTE